MRLERKEGYCRLLQPSAKPAEGPARVSAHTWDFGQNEPEAAVAVAVAAFHGESNKGRPFIKKGRKSGGRA